MIWKHHVGRIADEQPLCGIDAVLFQPIDLLHEANWIDDHSVADNAGGARAKDTRWDEVQDVLCLANNDRVAGVRATLGAYNDIGLPGQVIDDLALALVASLGAQ